MFTTDSARRKSKKRRGERVEEFGGDRRIYKGSDSLGSICLPSLCQKKLLMHKKSSDRPWSTVNGRKTCFAP